MGQKYEILAKFFFSKMVVFFFAFSGWTEIRKWYWSWTFLVFAIKFSILFACFSFLEGFSVDLLSRTHHQAFSIDFSRVSWMPECVRGKRNEVVAGKLNFNFWFLRKISVSWPSDRQPDCLFLHIKTKLLEKRSIKFRKSANSWEGRGEFHHTSTEPGRIETMQSLKFVMSLKKIKQQNFDNFFRQSFSPQ